LDNTSRIVEVATHLAAWTKPPDPPMTAEAMAASMKNDHVSISREEFRNRGKEASAKTYGAIHPLVEEFLDLLMTSTSEERAAGLKALFTSPSKDMGNAFLSWNPPHSDYDLTWKRYDAVRNAIVFIPIEDSRDTAMANANGNFNFTPNEGIVEEVSRLVREFSTKR
jgi:hypothetical protein